MSCPGLHCPGCSEGQSLGIAAGAAVALVLADQAVQWVAERIWWIGGTVAVCFAVSVALSMWLERRADARAARFGARHGIASRTDVDELTPAGVAWLLRNDQPRQQIAPVVHLHFHDAPASERAAIIRTAIDRSNP